mmetsp:Transcript_20061/g.29576  ORF Transcript_20061/g.29576 Transcript_20061/m.29576 type:complete len:226 (+) Transcript_20061:590-1267(+)
MKLVLILDHLWSLPVILYTCALKRELFYLDRNWATSLCFNHCNIILGLGSVHIHHPWLSNNTSDDTILRFPILGTIRRSRLSRIIFHHMLPLSHYNSSIRNIKQKWQRPRTLLNQPTSLLWILDINPIHLQQNMSQLHSCSPRRRSLDNKSNNGTIIQILHQRSIRLQKQTIRQLLRFEEHDSKCRSENSCIVPFSSRRQFTLSMSTCSSGIIIPSYDECIITQE